MQDAPRPGAHGFALLDALVALGLIAVVSGGVAWLLLWSSRGVWSAGAGSRATVMAQQKLEQLAALEWRFDEAGARQSDSSTSLSFDPPRAGGGGLDPSPPDTLQTNAAGYADYLDSAGRWCGSGQSPPRGAVFVRRWAVAPFAPDPADTLVLTVRVQPLGRHGGPATGAAAATLQTLRTRVMR